MARDEPKGQSTSGLQLSANRLRIYNSNSNIARVKSAKKRPESGSFQRKIVQAAGLTRVPTLAGLANPIIIK